MRPPQPAKTRVKFNGGTKKRLCDETHGYFQSAHTLGRLIRGNINIGGKNMGIILKGLKRAGGKYEYDSEVGLAAGYVPETGLYYRISINEKDGSLEAHGAYNYDPRNHPFGPNEETKILLEGAMK